MKLTEKLTKHIDAKSSLCAAFLLLMSTTSTSVSAKMDSNANHWNNCNNNTPTEKCDAIRAQQAFNQNSIINQANIQEWYERDRLRAQQNQNPNGEYQTTQLLKNVERELNKITRENK